LGLVEWASLLRMRANLLHRRSNPYLRTDGINICPFGMLSLPAA
jgi:hypothetical protein